MAKRKYPQELTSSRLYVIWNSMKARCYVKSSGSYRLYGKRGIKVCKEWKDNFLSFYYWSIKHGYSDNLTLDRIDCQGNYEPSNCRWATMIMQGNNRSVNVKLSFNGETHTIAEWSRITGLKKGTIQYRKYQGWSDEKILLTPLKPASSYPILVQSDYGVLNIGQKWVVIDGRKFSVENNGLLIRDDFSGIVHSLGLKTVEKALKRYNKPTKARVVCQRLSRIINKLKQE